MAKKLGIAGGGQLARMMLSSCIDWDCHVSILDIDGSVSQPFCQNFKIGDFRDSESVFKNLKDNDFVTIDLEAVSLSGLKKLEESGVQVAPSTRVLQIIQNKIKQKTFFKDNQIATSNFGTVENLSEKTPLGFLKIPEGGYDGKGVCAWKGDLRKIDESFKKNVLWEEGVDIEKEISVIGVRGISGEIELYEPTEMVFNHELNLISHTLFPSTLEFGQVQKAMSLAREVLEKLGTVGVLAIEMFLTKSGEILVNELAPRPHNSGHHTIESCVTSQFENHLRAVLGYSLGSCEKKYCSATLNVIGVGSGRAHWYGVDELMGIKGVHVHNYGKSECRQGRKMGHVTIIGCTVKEVEQKLEKVRSIIRVEGAKDE